VIWIKKNLKNPETKINSNTNNKIRFVKKTVLCERTVNCSNKKKIIHTANIKYTNQFNLITNLPNHYNNNTISNIYESRWDIEVFFKFLKYNFKFSNLNSKNLINEKIIYVLSLLVI